MLRLFEDNDYINIHFSGTDKAYPHGFKADIFYTKKGAKPVFTELLMFAAGAHSIHTFDWGIVQTMVTPNDLSNPETVASYYSYAYSISLWRTSHYSNSVKKFNLQTEYVLCVLGPIAGRKETQDAMHKLIHDEIPRGWNTQFKTSALLNINLTAEKQLFGIKKSIEYMGGVKSSLVTSLTALSVYTSLRVGKNEPILQRNISIYMAL